jgi:GNAT superfamily N-acetyltransferase
MNAHITVRPVETAADRRTFVDVAYRLNAGDPNWVPPLKRDVHGLITPGKNPWFGHGNAQLFLAERDGRAVGRISAHIDHLALVQPAAQGLGPGTGNWGMMEAADEPVFQALIAEAENWLRARGMQRILGPLSLSVWDEAGLQVSGFDHPPTVMMGHNSPDYPGWVEAAGHVPAKSLYTYELDIAQDFPQVVRRIVQSGKRNTSIVIRKVDKRRFDREAAVILGILNDAWSDNWGFVPLTDDEIAYAGRKLKPIVFEDLIMIAELEGEPVAFMITLPDLNEAILPLNGSLFPFGWAKLLLWLRRPRVRTMRVPLMGVVKRFQASRLASQVAFMMIDCIRRESVARYGASRAEIGWILDDNRGMHAIASAVDSSVNREYVIYEKAL